MRDVCIEQLASVNESKRLGLVSGVNPRTDFRNKFQRVKKTSHHRDGEIVCYYCDQTGHKKPDCPKFLAEKPKPKGHVMKRKNQPRNDKHKNFGGIFSKPKGRNFK